MVTAVFEVDIGTDYVILFVRLWPNMTGDTAYLLLFRPFDDFKLKGALYMTIRGTISLVLAGLVFIASGLIAASEPVLVTSYKDEVSYAHIEMERGEFAKVAVVFEGTDDLHYYADPETAPAPTLDLRIEASSPVLKFGKAVFPQPTKYFDKGLDKQIDVYVGDFRVLIPLTDIPADTETAEVSVKITGIACTSKLCLSPFEHTLTADLAIPAGAKAAPADTAETMDGGAAKTTETAREAQGAKLSLPFALFIALVSGVILNVMPCVWPVIPLIITRIWNQAGKNRAKSMSMGALFCLGILIFFAGVAILNLVLIFGYNTVFHWGDQWRQPGFLIFMTLLMVAMALFMFGVFGIAIPSSVTAKAGGGGTGEKSGSAGMVGMGFLAALLATPCSFGLLAVAVAWAQTQHWTIATLVLMFIGVGMALPYMVLTSVPGLLNKMPKPGGWMEKVKVGLGFLLLVIAVKFFSAVPADIKTAVLYFAVVLSFALWMWGGWVTFSTGRGKKYAIRIAAVLITVLFGFMLFDKEQQITTWREYDAQAVQQSLDEGIPVVIKFTADWCTNCTVLKKTVFDKTDVQQLLVDKGVALFNADTTLKDNPATEALNEKYKAGGIPFTVVHRPDGTTQRIEGMISKQDFKDMIKQL